MGAVGESQKNDRSEPYASTAPGPVSKVFISYASQDKALAETVCSAIERAGVLCWIAPRDVTPGEFYADAIVQALTSARLFVLVLTESAINSPHVLREVERTSAKRHPIISFRIDAVALPPALEYFLSASHWLDATASGVDAALPTLVQAVQRLVAPPSVSEPGHAGASAAPPSTPRSGVPLPARSDDGPAMVLWQRLRSHKVAQWTLAYGGAAYALLHVVEMISGALDWPHFIVRIVALLLLLGVPVATTFAWFHGHRAQHRISGSELAILTVLLVIAGTVLWVGGRPSHERVAAHDAAPADATAGKLATAVASASEKSIAVLPFVDMSETKDQEYFADGMAEELINHLSRNPGLKVIARTSSFQFKGRNEDVRSIAGKLGVAHVLEGSVRKAGQELRVTTQLIRASDGMHLWSQTYDRNLTDIFKVQDEISERVAQALDATLAITGRPIGQESDVEAYNLVLEGNYYKVRRNKGDVEKAIQLYKKAIDIRPNYALPWARLASAYLTLEEAKGIPSAEDNARILAALETALRLDPNLVWAYYTRAGFEIAIQWDWAAAQADHERMRALDPGIYLLPIALGDMALLSGHVSEAVQQYERAIELNPLDPIALRALGVALCASDRLQECLQYRLRLQQLHPELRGINAFVGEARLLLGQLPEALEAMQNEPERNVRLAGLATIYSAMGKHTESDAALKILEESYASNDAYEIAQLHAYRGEADEGFEWLQRSFRMHDSKILFIKTDPLLRNLRRDPRFQNLVAKLRLPE